MTSDGLAGITGTPTRMVYVTAGSMEEAEHIAARALEARLIACANILPEMRSIYRRAGWSSRKRWC